MYSVIAVVFGLMVSAPLVAEPLVEGWVRRSSGEPVEAAQVLVFDWTDLRRGAVARTTTDAAGYFALPLKSLGGSALPQVWTLGQNYPNPFNPSTIIPYQVPTAGRVRLEVFNVLGQRVATLVDEERLAGVHTAVWDATDAAGRAVGAGVYFYRLRSAGQPTLTRRMVLLDGQAGQAAASTPLPQAQPTAPSAERVYGLSVTGAGLVTYVDASFGVRSGMAAVEVVVDAVAGLPRGKALTDRVLGDVNGDGQVTLDDALLVTTYVVNGSVELPANGDISLGDVNGDGQVTLDDAQLLTAYVANPADGSLPAGIGQVVTSGGVDWVIGTIRRLTDNSAWDRFPSWSPDGRHIAFMSGSEIYVMGSDGSNPRNLTNHSAWDWSPSWSPDGRHIAFHSYRDGNSDIYVMGSDGSNPRRLTDHLGIDEFPTWSPDGRHIAFMSGSEIYVMGSDGSNLRNLTNHSADDYSPSWSPDGRHIAFMSRRDGNHEIYVMGSDGSNPRRLTNHSADDRWPSWSPDGRHIAFESWRDGNHEIYVMGSDGSNLRNLTNHWANDGFPSWSPDGRHIAFESWRDGTSDIYVIELRQEGNGETSSDHDDSPAMATPVAVGASIEGELSAGDSDYFRVTVSSPGTLVASTTGYMDTYGSIEDSSGNVLHEDDDGGEGRNFLVSASVEPGTYYIRVRGFDASGTGVYTLTLQMEEGSDGSGGDWFVGAIRRLTDHSAEDWYPSWSPDGRHITFQSNRGGNFEIYVMGSDGSNLRNLTNNAFWDLSSSWSWSPDGRHIAFESDRGGNFEIYVMGSDGSNLRNLTNNAAEDGAPSWSPDGRHIAFQSYRDGNFGIYVMGSDGSNQRRLTDHSADGGWSGDDGLLLWSPDGRHIAFFSWRRDGNGEIYVMGSDGSNLSNLTDHSAWDWNPSWSPDGRHIAFVSDRDGGSNIYVMGSDGSNQRRLTNTGSALSPSWSPDGRHIVFVSGRNIYVMGSDGSNQRRLTDYSADDEFPSWSPDGRHIAFVSGRNIYVMELFMERESPFDIDLVFLDDFTEAEQGLWHLIARRWEAAIQTELLDYEFSGTRSVECGDHSISISAGEQIDDLRIYITKFDKIASSDPLGHGRAILRRSSSMPIIGCIGIEQEASTQFRLKTIGLHEIGHVLGIGNSWKNSGMLRDLNGDPHFAGPQAIAAFNQAGGTNYQGAKVPTEQDGAHWRSSVLSGELMIPTYSSDNALSAITLRALSDLGYSVDLSTADFYVLPPSTAAKPVADAVPFCSLEGLPAPVYVDD